MIIAADNLTSSRPRVRRAIQERDAQFIADLCGRLQGAGANWLDLNPGFVAKKNLADTWEFLVKTAEKACGLTLLLDSPDPVALETALSYCTRPPVLNMATAEEGRLAPVLDLAARHNLPVVAATMTATVPPDADQRLALAALIVEEASQRGVHGARLILDPMIMPLALPGGETHAAAVLATLRALPFLFDPPPATLLGISNLATRSAHATANFASGPFLSAAAGAGLSIALMDALDPQLVLAARLAKVFNGQKVFAPAEY